MPAPVFWLIGRPPGPDWQPVPDLPPCFDQAIAEATAADRTRATETRHEIRGPWVLADPSRPAGPFPAA